MLLTWKSGSGTAAQIYDSGTGDPVGAPLTIAVPDHPWQGWKPFPDGSVAWAEVASASSTIKIARVLLCADQQSGPALDLRAVARTCQRAVL